MESRDGWEKAAGTSWIAIDECEKDSGCGTTNRRAEKVMSRHDNGESD